MSSTQADPARTRSDAKRAKRLAFLESCAPCTIESHKPIIDPFATLGHPNPAFLGQAEAFSRGSVGQSSVLFSDLQAYRAADACGQAPYGGAEYGVPCTPEVEAVCAKMNTLHGGHGAFLFCSGLSALTTILVAFAPEIVLLPDNSYYPLLRYLRHKKITHFRYPVGACATDIAGILARGRGEVDSGKILIHLEAPGSGTFEIPDLESIAALAQAEGIRTSYDNSWSSHVRFKPLLNGFDIVVQATTKYEGGYGDTPSGVVVCRTEQDAKKLGYEVRVSGNGAVSPALANRLLHRLESTEERIDRQYQTALTLMGWFAKQNFVSRIFCPALDTSPDHEMFNKYFGKGNGLFTILFAPDLPAVKVAAFADALNLFWIGQSWGGHLSLILPVGAPREVSPYPPGTLLRFHAGLEDPQDLLRDLTQAAQRVFG